VAPLSLVFVVVAIWELIVRVTDTPRYILPAPSAIGRLMVQEHSLLAGHFQATAKEAVGGFLLATVVSCALGAALAYSQLFRRTTMPLLVASKAVPTLAIAPIIVIWFGYTYQTKLLVAALACFFPITVNVAAGLLSVDPKRKAMFRALGAGSLKRFWMLDFRAALPSLFTGLKIAVPLCIIGAMVGEWVGAQSGLGYLILIDVAQLNITRMFAATMLMSLTGIALYLGVTSLENACLPFMRRSTQRQWRKHRT
jgi:ABC-type nitrate/sulfonate/bicarbonate transport system permease component